MRPIKLIAALVGICFASRSIARRRRPVAPRWLGRDWLLEDRRLLTSPGPVVLAAPQAAALLHEIRGHASQILERIHDETSSVRAAPATDDAGKPTFHSDGVQQSEGQETQSVETSAPDDSGGVKRDPHLGASDSPPASRPKYAIAVAAAEHGSTMAGHSPFELPGVGGVPTPAAPEETSMSIQGAAQIDSGIGQGVGSSSEMAGRGLFGDVHGDDRKTNPQTVENPSGPPVTDVHEVPSGTRAASLDAPKASDEAERRSTSTEMPSLSGLDHAARAFVTAIYGGTFDRLPEVVELKLWSRHLKAGVDPRLVAWRIWTSPEHRRLQRHGMVEPKAFQRAYEAATAAGRRAHRDPLSPPAGPLPSTVRGPSATSAGASRTGESHSISARTATALRRGFKIDPR
ncbi:MAG: hypothetical protein ACYC61_11510 [Isosphaeraceae bacterium]